MDVDDQVEVRSASSSTEPRSASVSAYVDLPITEVVAHFTDPGIDGLLASAIRAALGVTGEALVSAHADASVWVSSGNVHLSVTWRFRGPDGQANDGTAMVSLLVVQSGHDAITELLVTLPVSEERSASITDATHRILDEFTRRLEAAPRITEHR